MSDVVPYQSFPRGALIAAGAIVALSLAAATVSRFTGPAVVEVSQDPVVSRQLRFEDRADGSVAILDAADGAQVAIADPGTNGFLRATLRGLAQQRLHQSFGPATPFRLTLWTDGRLTLEDPDTHRLVELEAFGATNAAVFARFLPAMAQAPSAKPVP